MRSVLLDLETTRLEADKGIGFILCASMKLAGPKLKPVTFRIDQDPNYGKRDKKTGRFNLTDDSIVVKQTFAWLAKHDPEWCIWHFGDYFDGPYLNSRGLALGLGRMPIVRTVDTWKIAKYNLRLGGNSLDALAQHFDLDEQKMPVRKQVWQDAAYGSTKALDILQERCESDVRVLEAVFDRERPACRKLKGSLF